MNLNNKILLQIRIILFCFVHFKNVCLIFYVYKKLAINAIMLKATSEKKEFFKEFSKIYLN